MLAVALVFLGCGEGSESKLEVAPDFSLALLGGEGQDVTLSALRGKTVVVDFWATWCPPCEFQVPELNAFFDAHRDDPSVKLFGISIDTEGEEVVARWVGEKSVRYPILMGDDDLARRFGAMGFPTLIVIAPDGSVDSRHVGLIERDTLEAALARSRERAAL